jgi:hypothetical protein
MSTYVTELMFQKDVGMYQSFINRKIDSDFKTTEEGVLVVLVVSSRSISGEKRYSLNVSGLNDDQMVMMRHFEDNLKDYENNYE